MRHHETILRHTVRGEILKPLRPKSSAQVARDVIVKLASSLECAACYIDTRVDHRSKRLLHYVRAKTLITERQDRSDQLLVADLSAPYHLERHQLAPAVTRWMQTLYDTVLLLFVAIL